MIFSICEGSYLLVQSLVECTTTRRHQRLVARGKETLIRLRRQSFPTKITDGYMNGNGDYSQTSGRSSITICDALLASTLDGGFAVNGVVRSNGA